MWDQVLTSVRLDARSTKVLWTTQRLTPTCLRVPLLRLSPEITRRLYSQLERYHPLGHDFWIDQLFGLCGMNAVAFEVQRPQRLEIVRQWIEHGRITAWREAPPFTGPSDGDQPVDNAVLAPLYRAYAKQIGMDPGTVVALQAGTSGHKPAIPHVAAVPPQDQGKALTNTFNESCPAEDWRSESHRTAVPEVITWLKVTGGLPTPEQQDGVLGADGGGGFLVSTTRVSTLRKGTIVYRYYDAGGGAKNDGGWWTTQMVTGDPRQTLALPPADPKYSNSAKSLARARIGFDVTALTGLGAPRCSNKPGGPQQWFISWKDRQMLDVLRHPVFPEYPMPKDPMPKDQRK